MEIVSPVGLLPSILDAPMLLINGTSNKPEQRSAIAYAEAVRQFTEQDRCRERWGPVRTGLRSIVRWPA